MTVPFETIDDVDDSVRNGSAQWSIVWLFPLVAWKYPTVFVGFGVGNKLIVYDCCFAISSLRCQRCAGTALLFPLCGVFCFICHDSFSNKFCIQIFKLTKQYDVQECLLHQEECDVVANHTFLF